MDLEAIRMLETALSIDWRFELGEAAKRFEKDWQRMRGFERACQRKLVEFTISFVGDPSQARADEMRAFTTQGTNLVTAFTKTAESLSKFQFPKDLWGSKYKDPFKDHREAVRRFAQIWNLDPEFRALL